ncbi:hypothetical protein PMAYCL1PPCAC_01041, partial [Pristionchus mayeri]
VLRPSMSSSMADPKMSKDEYDLMHDLSMHSGLSFSSSSYEIIHKDFYNDFQGLFKPLVEEMKLTMPTTTDVTASSTTTASRKK